MLRSYTGIPISYSLTYSGSQLGASLSVMIETRRVASLRRRSWLHTNETRDRINHSVLHVENLYGKHRYPVWLGRAREGGLFR